MTTDLLAHLRGARLWLSLCLIGLVGLLTWQLVPEWRLNPQYQYGFLVPLLGLLLVFRAREGMPAARPRARTYVVVGLLLVLLGVYLVDIVATSNPDWRLAMWVYGLLVFVGIVLLLEFAGGWGLWFAGAAGLIFFAIPWPTAIEQWVVQGLMRVVAAVTGEVCNLVGVPVESHGSVLRLNSGAWVGVEDACSGVRSLQSSLMAAYFFSRWMCLGWRRSMFLFALAAGLSFLFNLIRAIGLTLLAHFQGVGAVDRWHDFAGNSVALLVFFALLVISLRMERDPRHVSKEISGAGDVPRLVPTLGFVLLCGVPLFSWFWFSVGGSRDPIAELRVDWAAVPGRVRYEPVAERSRALLRYTEGEHGWWQVEGGMRVDLYEFRWDSGRISSFGEIHRPDVCLPASGLAIVERDPEWRSLDVSGRKLVVERFAFEDGGLRVFVYFCAWDAGESLLVNGFGDRIRNAWRGRRVDDRRVVQVLVSGAPGGGAADVEVEALLGRVLR